MNELVQFIKKTKQLLDHLEKGLPENNREEFIQTVDKLLDERQNYLAVLPDLSSNLEGEAKANLVETEEKIQGLLGQYTESIKQDLKVLQLKKKKSSQYTNPYGNISADGMFLDKKK